MRKAGLRGAKARRRRRLAVLRGKTSAVLALAFESAGFPSCEGKQGAARQWLLEAAGSRSRVARPLGLAKPRRQTAGLPECRRETRRGLSIGRLEAEGSRRAKQDKGRRRRAKGAGRAAQKQGRNFHVTVSSPRNIGHPIRLPQNFAPPAAEFHSAAGALPACGAAELVPHIA